MLLDFDQEKKNSEMKEEERRYFKEPEKTHFPQQLLHVGENLAEIEGS